MLTPEQINEIRAKSGLQPIAQQGNGQQAGAKPANAVGKYDYLLKKQGKSGIMNDLATRAKKVVDETKKNYNDIADTYAKNKNIAATAFSATAAPFLAAGSAMAEGAKMIAPEALKKDAKSLVNAVATNPHVQKDVIQPLMKLANDHPQTARAVKDFVDIISVLPATKGASVAADVAVTGAKNAGKVVADGAAAVGKTAARATGPVGKAIEKAGEVIGSSAIPLNDVEAGLVQGYKAKNSLAKRLTGEATKQPETTGLTAYKRGYQGTEAMIGVQAKRDAADLWDNTVKPALEKIKQTINPQTAIANAERKLLAGVKNPSRVAELKDGFAALREDWKNMPRMTHSFAQDVKSEMYKFIPDKMWKGKPVASAFKEAQAAFAHELRGATRNLLPDSAKEAFDMYGNIKNIMEFGKKAMTGGKKKGGFGSFWTSAYENATVPAKTIGGQILKKTGKALQSKK